MPALRYGLLVCVVVCVGRGGGGGINNKEVEHNEEWPSCTLGDGLMYFWSAESTSLGPYKKQGMQCILALPSAIPWTPSDVLHVCFILQTKEPPQDGDGNSCRAWARVRSR